MFRKLLALLLFIGMVSGQSYVCSRTAASDTYCNDDGTRTTIFYSYQPNVLTEAGWQPFEDVAVLEYKDDHFELSYGNQTARIDLFAVVDSKETDTRDTELKIEPIIIKQHGGFEYGVRLDNSDKIEAFGFRIGGDEIKGIKYDFSDANTEKTAVTMQDSKTALVSNPTRAKVLVIDPTITLTDVNNANIADSFVCQGASSTNYGTATTMWVSEAFLLGNANRTLVMWDMRTIPVGATITNANFSMYMTIAPVGSRTYQTYNTTTYVWTETGVTWANQPAAGTLQQAIATGTTDDVWLSWNVTNASKVAQVQQINMSLLIRDSSEGIMTKNYSRFYSRDYATASKRPKLVITYTSAESLPETGLVGYWRFNEGSGITTDDSSGNGNIGQITGATWITSKYNMNNTLNYNGSANYVLIPDSTSLTTSSKVTFSAWVKLNSTTCGGECPIILRATALDTTNGYYLHESGGTFTCIIGNGTAGGDSIGCSGATTNTWAHIACTLDGSTHLLTMYKNGLSCNSKTIVGSLQDYTGQYLRFGYRSTWDYYLNGTIDEVKIYNRSLSASEVLAEYLKNGCLYNMNISCFNESSTSQQIYYDLILSNSTASETFSDMWNWTSNEYCNGSTPLGSVTVSVSNDSFYSPRYYYKDTSASQNVTAYLLPLSSQYPILTTFYVLYSGQAVPNAEITVQKWIGSGWTTIAQKMTDSAGGAAFNLDYSASYYFITNASGYSVRYDPLTPTSTIYYLTLSKTSGAYDEWSTYWNQYEYACELDNSSYPLHIHINCSVNDTSGLMQYARLRVWEIGNYGNILKCDTNETANATLGCTIANAGNKTYQYTLVAHFQGELLLLQRIAQFFDPSAFKSVGVMPAMLVVLTCGLVGIWNPALGIVGLVGGLGAVTILGLLELPIEGFAAIAIVAAILIYELRS